MNYENLYFIGDSSYIGRIADHRKMESVWQKY